LRHGRQPVELIAAQTAVQLVEYIADPEWSLAANSDRWQGWGPHSLAHPI
jgi:hypothetical protein